MERTIKFGTPKSPNKELVLEMEKMELNPGETTKIMATFRPVETKDRLTGTVVIPLGDDAGNSVKIRVWGRINES
jgi:hypothetical protein